jgi:hypothetical protein
MDIEIYGSSTQKYEPHISDSYSDYNKIHTKYPEWIPIILHSKSIQLRKSKYLVRPNISFKNFISIVEKNLNQTNKSPLFFIINKILISVEDNMKKLYECYKNTSGFLHIQILSEKDLLKH